MREMRTTSKSKKALVVAYNYLLNDPPGRQTIESLCQAGYQVTLLQSPPQGVFASTTPPAVKVIEYNSPTKRGGFSSFIRWIRFRLALAKQIHLIKLDLVVAFMHHSLAALPKRRTNWKLVVCIYDIPYLEGAGRLDRHIIKTAWNRIDEADLIWCSDPLKAEWTIRFGHLLKKPFVCHNCPPVNYLKNRLWPRNLWLRNELIRLGAPLHPKKGGSILLRAGAIGDYCGLEETLDAMQNLPDDYVYLMLGRPNPSYLTGLKNQISRMGLQKRAFVWDKASDEVWKKALQGADIGQMIHIPPSDNKVLKEIYNLNSGLSYNRTYLYMAWGLPILSYDDPRLKSLYQETGCFRSARLSHLTQDIEKIWRELGKSQALRRQLGSRARQAHLKSYNWEKEFSPILKSVNELVEKT
jgi:glycosyltransferase involved in cell wall biosynthesis